MKLEEKASIDWNNYLKPEEVQQFLQKDDKVESAENIIYSKEFRPRYKDLHNTLNAKYNNSWNKKDLVQDLVDFYQNGHLMIENVSTTTVDINKLPSDLLVDLEARSENTDYKKLYNKIKNSKTGKVRLSINDKDLISAIYTNLPDNEYDQISNVLYKLEEASRNELLSITRRELDLRSKHSREANPNGPYSNRLERSAGYKGFSLSDIDTSKILTDNAIVIHLQVGDYDDVVELEDILYWIQIGAENARNTVPNQINTKIVTQALMNAMDGMDIKLDCSCADWQYRFAYQATLLGYKYGEKEGRPNEDARANPDNRGGVCFRGNTLVLTENGFKQIKDIEVGDKVFTHKGRLKEVKNKSKRTVNNYIRLNVASKDIDCTDNHPFYICSTRGNSFKFKPVNELKAKSDCILSPQLNLISNINVNKNYAFLLGLFLANGNLGYRTDRLPEKILTSNIEIAFNTLYIDFYKNLLDNMNIKYSINSTGDNNSGKIKLLDCIELRDFIVKYGGFNYKDESTKFISNEVLNWDLDSKLALIRGFFVGDGQYGCSGKYLNMRFLNTNQNIIDMLHILLRSIGVHSKYIKFNRQPRQICDNTNISIAKPMYCLTITGQDINIIDNDICRATKGAKSQDYEVSKYKCKLYSNDNINYYGAYNYTQTNINETIDVYNLEVDEDESYLVTTDLWAVHNCKHLTSVLSNKRWLQQVTSKLMNWVEEHIDGVNKYLGLKGDKQLTLPNELARQNAKLSWQIRRDRNAEKEQPEEQQPEETKQDVKPSVQGNNPSTNKYNNIADNSIEDESK